MSGASEPYRIALAGPWQWERAGERAAVESPQSQLMESRPAEGRLPQCRLPLATSALQALRLNSGDRLHRTFHLSNGLLSELNLRLCLRPWPVRVRVSLNGQRLGDCSPGELTWQAPLHPTQAQFSQPVGFTNRITLEFLSAVDGMLPAPVGGPQSDGGLGEERADVSAELWGQVWLEV